MTLRCNREILHPDVVQLFNERADKHLLVNRYGEVLWQVPVRENIRSDTHQLTVGLTARGLEITGSPARVFHDNNVFGSGDPILCFDAMVRHVIRLVGVFLPLDPKVWLCTKIDVTHNYLFDNPGEVRQALQSLRHAQAGHQKVDNDGDTVYWQKRSRHKSGKAYQKGPQLRKLVLKNTAKASDDDIAICNRVLRLELSLKSHWWRNTAKHYIQGPMQPGHSQQMIHHKHWWEFSEGDLEMEHQEYFSHVIGTEGIVEVSDLEQKCIDACQRLSKHVKIRNPQSAGMQAFKTYCYIKQVGYEQVKMRTPKATFYRHVKVLRELGLSVADLQKESNVIPLRRKVLVISQPIRSWEELRAAA